MESKSKGKEDIELDVSCPDSPKQAEEGEMNGEKELSSRRKHPMEGVDVGYVGHSRSDSRSPKGKEA